VHRQVKHFDPRDGLGYPTRHIESAAHPECETQKNDVGCKLLGALDGGAAVADRGYDLEVPFQHTSKRPKKGRVLVGQEDSRPHGYRIGVEQNRENSGTP
jgi:hypothetical protein